MHLKKLLWIVNPHAGRGAMRGKLIDCILAFQQAGFDVTLHVTEGPEDATRVAKARAGEFDRIVCAGGDGTLNLAVSGLMTLDHPPLLGYIPQGSTNDFAASLHLSSDPAAAAEQIAQGKPQRLDIGPNVTLSMWPPSGPLPAAPIPPPRPPKTPWAIWPTFWRG